MPQLTLQFSPTYRDYISVVNARFSSVSTIVAARRGEVLPRWVKLLLKPAALSWATYSFIAKKRKIGPLTITIDALHIRTASRRGSKETTWSSLASIEQHDSGYILVAHDDTGILIPKRIMTDSERMTLETFIASWRLARQPEG